jgi:hypothetical protein
VEKLTFFDEQYKGTIFSCFFCQYHINKINIKSANVAILPLYCQYVVPAMRFLNGV